MNEFGCVHIAPHTARGSSNLTNTLRTRFISMPSFYTWEEALEDPADFEFNSTVVMSRDHHPPARLLDFPNPNAPQGQYEMTAPVELWLPTPSTPDRPRARVARTTGCARPGRGRAGRAPAGAA